MKKQPEQSVPRSRFDAGHMFDFPSPNAARSESSARALLEHSFVQCKRLLLRWSRDPATMIQALLYPALTLVMFRLVLGDSVSAATGQPAIYGNVPLIALVGAMFGSVVSAVGLKLERKSGLLSRFWTLPVHRASGLVGRMLAEAVRVFATTVLIVAVGMLLGFRFNQGLPAAVAMMLVPVLFGMGFAVMVTALATISGDAPLVELVSILCTLLMFFNSGFVPVFAYPTWLQPIVQYQPMSCAVDAMRGLSLGGPVLEPLLQTTAWSLGLIAIFLYPAIRGYRRAAATG
ncbi:daunorubicin-DIM-transport integral membrane protein ABC transporter DrrC [Rhodococcus aetherivorans]|uniref:Transport permease protein n=2 Tax=Rhodococcus aetherivorans TaxID=191292 RepID=A0ABQ0YQP8_9NOCA|nr:ABC-2 type transporter [Rhodococcus rhodochrous ATCC 21198]KDE12485.1 peptide ABC transporter permease [Rhodococcus aetherivorans]GES38776.1 daunorubicin-DIM-transport integral membrane protein ABC transporter DrrC [Rhodococcus aetherivorans]